MTLAEINDLDRELFTIRLGGLAEDSPWVAYGAWEYRPFATPLELVAGFRGAIARAAEERQVALLQAHPELAGSAAVAGDLGAASAAEQAAAGLDRLQADDQAAFGWRNSAYRERFGFPFVICAREHTRQAILAAFDERLAHERDEELAIALDEVVKIIRLRVGDLLAA